MMGTESDVDEQMGNNEQTKDEQKIDQGIERPDKQAYTPQSEGPRDHAPPKQGEQNTTPDISTILQGAMGGKQLTLEDLVQVLQHVSGA